MKRLLIVGANQPWTLATMYGHAFRRIGVEHVEHFDADAGIAQIRRHRLLSRVGWHALHHIVARQVDAFFSSGGPWDAVLVVKGLFLSARSLARARAHSPHARWICLNPDDPFSVERASASRHIRETIPLYDLYLIWSHSLLPQLRAAGARRVAYLPFGHDPALHFPSPERDPDLDAVVTFVGAYDRQRASILEGLASLPIRVYGAGWERVSRFSPLRAKVVPQPLYGADLRRVISSSLATLNLLRAQNEGSHNMRTFEVPAMGGLMVTQRTPEQHGMFPEHRACLMFSSEGELRTLVEQLVRGQLDTSGIRADAFARSSEHTYDRRARAIIAMLGEG